MEDELIDDNNFNISSDVYNAITFENIFLIV